MPSRQPKPRRPVPSVKPPGPAATLRQALARRKKAELVDALVELAEGDRGILRQLTARFDVTTTLDELVATTHQAIADATDFDERQINHNFDYDYEAYAEVERNLGRLIASGQLRRAMTLALELMEHGSHQVEMSDEGLMAEDVEACLKVVIEAVTKSNLPAEEVLAWCSALLKADRIGFIARGPLEALRCRVETDEAQ
jgi:predicted outer membrane protein